MPRTSKRFNSILPMQILSMIRCQSLHSKTFWLANNEEKHLKETNLLGNMWFKLCSLWPVTSCQSSQGHIKGVLCLVSQDDAHHGKVLGRQGSPTAVPQQWQWVSGCWVCGAAAACPVRKHGSRALVCPGELQPTPFISYKGHLENCVTETELVVSGCQTGCGECGVNFLCSLWTHHWGTGSDGLQTDLDTLFKSVTAAICSM